MGMISCKVCDSVIQYYNRDNVSKLYSTCPSCHVKATKK